MDTSDQKDFSIRVSMLASSSTGNVTYIETPKQKLLVDAGLSGKKIENLLSQIDRKPEDIDGILVTHEHSDHVKGLGVMARRYGMPIYANEPTWQAIGEKCGKIAPEQKEILSPGEVLTLGDLDIWSFGVSHDAAQAQFYGFQKDNKQFAMLTDLGYVSERLEGFLKNCDAYLMESNHDADMLRMGRYPWHLKQRIFSDTGHLSNDDAGEALSEMIGDKTKRVYLGHLSEENNMKQIASQTVSSVLAEHDIAVGDALELYDTDPEAPTALYTL